jgi:vancomycin resistance protein YoaR
MDMRKKLVIVIVAAVLLSVTAAVPIKYAHATEQNWSNIIYPGVYIEGIDVSGKDVDEALRIIEEKVERPILTKIIQIKTEGKTYTLNYKDLHAEYNTEDVVKSAFNYGKEGNMIEKYMMIKSAARKQFDLNLSYNEQIINDLVDRISQDINREPIDAKVSVVDGNVQISSEINGSRLLKDKLMQDIKEQINGELAVGNIQIDAPVEAVRANITSDKLSSVNARISSFGTNFSTSNYNRMKNIELATKSINGTLLMPGETFSFNETVGMRTRERGFLEAGVIINDKIESGLGGGICQVSSTLYNTMLRANIKAVERRNHSLPLGYVGKGLDATVDWGTIDYKFTNTLNYPIYIEGYVRNKNVYFNFYSGKELAKYTYEMTTEVYDTTEPVVKYTEDPNRYEDEEEVVKKPSTGYKLKVYRKTYENGKLIKTELISRDTYKVVNGEIIRGTKKREIEQDKEQ